MSVLIAEELEAAIVRDPDDLSAFAVYGDWLAERGDPRGELVATQLAADATNDPELRRAALAVFAKHRDRFLGSLGSMIAARAFTWRAGFIRRADLAHDLLLVEDGAPVAASLADVVGALLAHPSAKFLVELAIRTNDRGSYNRITGTQQPCLDRLVAARPRVLRRLQLGDLETGTARIGKLDHVWPAIAGVRELVLAGELALGRAVAPELRSLTLAPAMLRRRLAHQIVEARWPKLQALTIRFGTSPDHVSREINELVRRSEMPELVHLGLLGYRDCDRLVEVLARSPLAGRLQTLDLTGSRISRRGLERAARLVPNVVGDPLTRRPA